MAGPYFVDNANGNDINSGLSEVLAFATLQKAAETVADGEIVYVQSGTSYTVQHGATGANLEIQTEGTVDSKISWIGYTQTGVLDDNGVVTIDAGSGWANVVKGADAQRVGHNNFKNFRFTGSTADGISGTSADSLNFENCQIDNNPTNGVHLDNNISFINCEIHNNGNGINADISTKAIACKFHDNTGYGMVTQSGLLFACEFYNETNGGVQFSSINNTAAVINCTFDGDDDTGIGIDINDSAGIPESVAIINNIFNDLATGIESDTIDFTALPLSDAIIVKNNLFNSNTADATRINTGEDAIIDDPPLFTNEAGRDYTLGSSSSAIDTGYDGGSIT